MTERDAVKQVVEKSITKEVKDWCYYRHQRIMQQPKRTKHDYGEAYAYLMVAKKIDELEANT